MIKSYQNAYDVLSCMKDGCTVVGKEKGKHLWTIKCISENRYSFLWNPQNNYRDNSDLLETGIEQITSMLFYHRKHYNNTIREWNEK